MTRYAQNPDVVAREETDEGIMLFNPDTNQIRVLNDTGMFIWKLCDGTRDKATIVQLISAEYEAVPGDVSAHVESFLEQMIATEFVGVRDE